MSPDTIGRYKLARELGRGAMGVVFEASDPNLGRTVALKTIQANTIGTDQKEVTERFKNEARAVGGLSHTNIVTVFDAGEDNGVLYIAMELLEGKTLEELLKERRTLPLDQAINITRQICAALDYANNKGIVHRDVKPANVMLTSKGTVKITDFGLARTTEAITMTGHVVGTPHYMSPEQVRGRPVDVRSDLFSVGVMLYEMLTGERPFEGQSITTIMYKIVHENPTPPRALDSSIPPGLSAVVERSLAKSPEDRYQSGAALVEALENYKKMSATQSAANVGTVEAKAPVIQPETPKTPAASAKAVRVPRKHSKVPVGLLFGVLSIIGLIVYKRFEQPKPGEQTNTQTESKAPVSAPAPPAAPSTDKETKSETAKPVQPGEVVQKQPAVAGKDTARLTVKSFPPTAMIAVDGKSTGMPTPAQLQLPRGEHVVTVEMDGFKPSSAKFRVKGGEELEFSPTLSVQLPGMPSIKIPDISVPGVDVEKLTGLEKQKQLRSSEFWQQWAKALEQRNQGGASASDLSILVHTRPGGASIWVDGEDAGKQSPAIIPEKPGTYKVRVQLDGYEPVEREVKVESGRPAIVNVTLKPTNGKP